MADELLTLRPHHILLVSRFVTGHFDAPGKLDNMLRYFGNVMVERCQSSAKQIKQDQRTQITIIRGPDPLCGICLLHEECQKGNIELIREALGLKGRVKYKNAQELDNRVMEIYNKPRPKDNPFIYDKEYEAREFPRI